MQSNDSDENITQGLSSSSGFPVDDESYFRWESERARERERKILPQGLTNYSGFPIDDESYHRWHIYG